MLAVQLLWVALNSHISWIHQNSGPTECFMEMGWQGMAGTLHAVVSPLLTCRLYCPIRLHSQNTSSKALKNFKTGIAKH